MNLITYTKEHFREKNILYGFLAALLFLAVFCCTCTVQAAIDPDRTPEEIPGQWSFPMPKSSAWIIITMDMR